MIVTVSSDAEADLSEGFWFYEHQLSGLGNYFRSCLISDIESLIYFAGIHERVDGFHRAISKRFPYMIYYHVVDEVVTVIAVLDARRNPQWIRKRLA